MQKEKNIKLKAFLKKFKKINFSFGFDGDKDWVTIFFTSVAIFIFISAWSIYMYLYAKTDIDSLGENSQASAGLINQKALKQILERYDQKKNNNEEISIQRPALYDPAR